MTFFPRLEFLLLWLRLLHRAVPFWGSAEQPVVCESYHTIRMSTIERGTYRTRRHTQLGRPQSAPVRAGVRAMPFFVARFDALVACTSIDDAIVHEHTHNV